jgi:hypothetical protein
MLWSERKSNASSETVLIMDAFLLVLATNKTDLI